MFNYINHVLLCYSIIVLGAALLMALRIIKYVVGPLRTNFYIIYDSISNEAVLLDPGGLDGRVERAVEEEGLKPVAIASTHGHFDHVLGAPYYAKKYQAPFAMSSADLKIARASVERFVARGVCNRESLLNLAIDLDLLKIKEISVGEHRLKVILTPGHTPGSIVLYAEGEGVAFTGDTIFKGAVGRVDLEGGSEEELANSLRRLFKEVPSNAVLYPGHGPETTMGDEASANTFLRRVLKQMQETA